MQLWWVMGFYNFSKSRQMEISVKAWMEQLENNHISFNFFMSFKQILKILFLQDKL